MKRLLFTLLALMLFTGIDANAQVYKFRTTDFASRSLENGVWTEWSDWASSDVLVVINLDRDVIDIYSPDHQEFNVYDYADELQEDSDGSSHLELKCVDIDGIRCTLRVRWQADGVVQLYVHYSNLSYVYCLEQR